MKPMVYNSTPFISYHDINLKDIDLVEDAYGFNSEFYDVICALGLIKSIPDKSLTRTLIDKIRKQV